MKPNLFSRLNALLTGSALLMAGCVQDPMAKPLPVCYFCLGPALVLVGDHIGELKIVVELNGETIFDDCNEQASGHRFGNRLYYHGDIPVIGDELHYKIFDSCQAWTEGSEKSEDSVSTIGRELLYEATLTLDSSNFPFPANPVCRLTQRDFQIEIEISEPITNNSNREQ